MLGLVTTRRLAAALIASSALFALLSFAHFNRASGVEPEATIVVDADPTTAGVQVSRTVASDATFDVDIVLISVSEPYQAFQWNAEWPDALANLLSATNNDDGNALWDSMSTGFDFCPPTTQNFTSPGLEQWMGACIELSLTSPTTSFKGILARLTLQCVNDGVVDIHLNTYAEEFQFGTFLVPDIRFPDNVLEATTTDASVTCGTPGTPTPTASPTPMPTRTPLPCLTRSHLALIRQEIRQRFGMTSTDPLFDPLYDVDASGTVDAHDLAAAAHLDKCWVPARQ